jgi:hypothetical protein
LSPKREQNGERAAHTWRAKMPALQLDLAFDRGLFVTREELARE